MSYAGNPTTVEREELEKFLASLSDYQPALPDELVRHYLSRSGFTTDDVRVERFIALAAQKFLADIATDAISHARIRSTNSSAHRKSNAAAREAKVTLTVDDLERALREYGVSLKKPPYFADSVTAGAPEAGQVPNQGNKATQSPNAKQGKA